MKAFAGKTQYYQEGMDLRDYFAAKIAPALVRHYREMFMDDVFEDWRDEALPELAEEAYLLADHMMKARGVKDE